jgi:hypothetical protein
LVRIHEAGITHHVATIGEIDRQDGSATVFDGRVSMTMDVGVFRASKISAKKESFDSPGKVRAGGKHILEGAMFLAHFSHQNSAILFQNVRFDLTRVLVNHGGDVSLAADN